MNEQQQIPQQRAAALGRQLFPVRDTAARTDVGADGEEHAYRSGTSIFRGMYDAVNGSWVYVEMTP